MPRTIEHIAETHAIAAERRAQGRPVWDSRIDVSAAFHAYDADRPETFVPMRDEVVRIIRATPWAREDSVEEILDELAETDDVRYFDLVWDALYDQADLDRIWIDTHSAPRAEA